MLNIEYSIHIAHIKEKHDTFLQHTDFLHDVNRDTLRPHNCVVTTSFFTQPRGETVRANLAIQLAELFKTLRWSREKLRDRMSPCYDRCAIG